MAKKKEEKPKEAEEKKDEKVEETPEESEALKDIVEEEKSEEAAGKEKDYNSIFDDDYVEEEAKPGKDKPEDEDENEEEESKEDREEEDEEEELDEEDKEDIEEEELDEEDKIVLKESKDKGNKKSGEKSGGFPAKKVLVMISAIFLLLLGAYLGMLYFKSQNEQKKESAPAVTEEPKKEEAKKEVYVTAEGGLNMRKEPSASSEVLAVIPDGTKLVILDEKDDWYKVEYDDQTGWISKKYTSEKNPLVYENTEYGFTLTFPSEWATYKITEKDADNSDGTTTKVFYVGIKTADPNYSSTVGTGYADMFVISILTPDQWATVEASDGPKPIKIAENDKYVFTSSPSQAGPDDVVNERDQMSDILKTFKLI